MSILKDEVVKNFIFFFEKGRRNFERKLPDSLGVQESLELWKIKKHLAKIKLRPDNCNQKARRISNDN